jgi:hypothetical protein
VPEPGEYSIRVSQIASTADLSGFVLKDLYTNSTYALKQGTSIPFMVTNNPSTSGKRFLLTRNAETMHDREPIVGVYPNPVSDVVSLEFVTDEDVAITIFNASGVNIYEAVIKSELGIAQGAIDMRALPSGLYILKSRVGGQMIATKLIKL